MTGIPMLDSSTPIPIPDDGGLDSSLALLREGYAFIPRRCERLGTDIFRTRLMGRTAICVRGPAWAEMFYDGDRFTRRGGLPQTALRLLQDWGSVMTLDEAAHRHRKSMLLSIMGPDASAELAQAAREEWLRRLPAWEKAREVRLFDEMRSILFHAVCAWAGVPVGKEADQRLHEMTEMVESAGSVGPRNWRAQLLRTRTERWARALVREARAGFSLRDGSALSVIAAHRGEDGRLLDIRDAAVELINVIRPTVAIARYVVFAALAFHRHPRTADPIRAGHAAYLEAFAQEVRRMAPFIPMIGGRALRSFEWRGHRFEQDDWVLIDLFGTDRDGKLWDWPDEFRPERFIEREPTPYDLIAQGAGDHPVTHRCPGEWITMEVLKMSGQMLARLTYEVPPQDLSVNLSRIPALPASGFVLRNVSAGERPTGDCRK